MRKIVSKFALAVGIVLAMVFTLSCSSDGGGDDDGDSSSSLHTPSSSSAYIPPTVPTMDEACNSYWVQAINQIANQCSNATISITSAPPTNQTYGYDCSLTQADVNAVLAEVCSQMPPSSTCNEVCASQVYGSMGKSRNSSAFCYKVAAECGASCKDNYSFCSR